MKCSCGGNTKVIDIRHDEKTGIDYRERVCKKCGEHFFTKEEYVFDSDEFMCKWRKLDRARRKRYAEIGYKES